LQAAIPDINIAKDRSKDYWFGVKRVAMVRQYRPDDLEAVVMLFQSSVREVASRDYSPAQVSAWAPEPPDSEAWARRLGTGGVFVYERNDQIAGFVRVDDNGCVDLLYVHPEVQRQGVARALFDRVRSWAVSRGIRHLRSEVSTTARPFFEGVGFRIVREQVVERCGASLQNFRMERDIDAEPLG
jgi:putative acetyltransferase